MGAVIAMAVYSTEENQKDECLERTLFSLTQTVDFTKEAGHKLAISVNAKTRETERILAGFRSHIDQIFYNDGNIGTAEAINRAWYHYPARMHKVKMDDDIEIYRYGWLDELIRAVDTDPSIGICGLKRKDCIETPWNENPHYQSKLFMLPHIPGEPWVIGEEVNHVMGSCQLYNFRLLKKIGYLYQLPGNKYGFDDALAAVRCQVAGFRNVFLPHIDIDHIDEGKTPYQGWKEKNARSHMAEYHATAQDYWNRTLSIYYNPFDK